MPVKRSAYKELRKAKLRHYKNISTASEIKTLTKKFLKLTETGKTDEAKKLLSTLVSKMDRAASKGVMKRNAASRKIARLMKKLSATAKAAKA